MCYWATVQSVFLFRSKTWTVTHAYLTMIEGFHVRTACHMVGMMSCKLGNVLKYPTLRLMLNAAGLRPIDYYIGVGRNTIVC